jgi:purine-nucleoside phosphorylase
MASSPIESISQSADFIRGKWPFEPRFGLILGTGSGQVADQIMAEEIIPYHKIPRFPLSTAIGHKGHLVCGTLAGQPIIAMQGRFHLYEGYAFDTATLPVHVLHQLGVEYLFVTNASGGLNPNFNSGEIMAIESHIDLQFKTSHAWAVRSTSSHPRIMADCYDRQLTDQALACGRRLGFPVHQGVYAAMLGPNFETRAEYRFLRRIGADAAGMSTVPEVYVASRYGMKVLGLSIIANVAKPDVLTSTSGQEVIDLAEVAGPQLEAILVNALERL